MDILSYMDGVKDGLNENQKELKKIKAEIENQCFDVLRDGERVTINYTVEIMEILNNYIIETEEPQD